MAAARVSQGFHGAFPECCCSRLPGGGGAGQRRRSSREAADCVDYYYPVAAALSVGMELELELEPEPEPEPEPELEQGPHEGNPPLGTVDVQRLFDAIVAEPFDFRSPYEIRDTERQRLRELPAAMAQGTAASLRRLLESLQHLASGNNH
eukprot:COSAG02_NODE_11505_length_1710_cov_5.982863_2_plen_149_part_01